MNYHLRLRPLLLLSAFLILSISCREDSITEKIELQDEDMLAATTLAEEYLNSSGARSGSEMAITVLKFIDGVLYYATDTDSIISYVKIAEESITASAKPGEYIFWYSGGGVSDLDGIVFDEESQLKLVDAPAEIDADKMWMLQVPVDFNEPNGILKYDIIYNFAGNDGPPIRLDPKIKIQDANDE